MAKFLRTTGVSHHLEELIKNSKERLVLISPFLKTNDRIRELLEDKDRMKTVDIRVVYGKKELESGENSWLKSMRSIRASFCENLHAKCYLNESEAVITSMNLYEFSQVNNNEMGIYVSRDDDASLYTDIYEEAMRLVRISGDEPTTSDPKVLKEADKTIGSRTADSGFCIHCHKEIKLNPMVPYCRTCYKTWNKNDVYQEKFCHICGSQRGSTKAKPACRECWKKYKDLLEFPPVLAGSSAK